MRVDSLDHGGVDAHPAGKDEVALTRPAQIDLSGCPIVEHGEQVLGRVDDVVRDAKGAADDIGGAAGQYRYRHVGAGEAVSDLVQRAIAAKRHDDVITVVAYLAADLGGVVLRLGGDGLHLIATLQRVDDEVLEPIGDGRRVRVDDQQHPLLGGLACFSGAEPDHRALQSMRASAVASLHRSRVASRRSWNSRSTRGSGPPVEPSWSPWAYARWPKAPLPRRWIAPASRVRPWPRSVSVLWAAVRPTTSPASTQTGMASPARAWRRPTRASQPSPTT